MSENFLMKDSINKAVLRELASNIKKSYKSFDSNNFQKSINKDLKKLELKQRIQLVTDKLHEFLPNDYLRSLDILLNSLPDELPNYSKKIEGYGENVLKGMNGFIMVSVSNFVSDYGIDYFNESMSALSHMTRRFSSEEAARYFIKEYPEKTLNLYKKWLNDENMHVRRLISESTRSRLPWTMQLPDFIKNPSPIIPLLEKLKSDKELYVRRSVANNLNDISKDNPKIVTDLLKKWSKDDSKEMKWLIKHALRTLVKKGDREALKILGYKNSPKVDVSSFKLSRKKIRLGEVLEFNFCLKSKSKKDEKLMIDYVINHVKSNGSLAPKVFKLKNIELKAMEEISLSKKHGIKKITTRKYYSGKHEIMLQVNGKIFEKLSFDLKV